MPTPNRTNGLKEAKYYDIQPDFVICRLCPHYCHIKPDHHGRCLGRVNHDGILYAESYGQITSIALDPIEKKPLKRFFPGSTILSVGSYGCNLACEFCQNWQISQRHAESHYYPPQELVDIALAEQVNGNIGIAFTYNEPFITFEYVLDTSRLAHQAGLKTVLVTNGLVNPEPLQEILPHIDAMNIDLKAFHAAFYNRYCHGPLEPVKRTIETAARVCHVELTTLLIPGLNDDEDEIEQLASWVASIDRLIPLHLTRHHPAYKMTQPGPISIDRLQMLAKIARRHLSDVYLGNI